MAAVQRQEITTPQVQKVESTSSTSNKDAPTDLEQKKKLEDRARRFAQPSALAEPQTVKTAVKRLSSDTLINSSGAPLVKQAKIMASRKVVAKANFVQQRKEQLNRVQQQQRNMQAAAQLSGLCKAASRRRPTKYHCSSFSESSLRGC